MDSPRYVVEPAPDDEVFSHTDDTVWFHEPTSEAVADKIRSLAWGRFAALEQGAAGASAPRGRARRRTPACTASAR